MLPADRFGGLAADYAAHRPAYPPAIVSALRDACARHAPAPGLVRMILDVGSGTGIASRLLRTAFGPAPTIVGVEISADMLAEARRGGDYRAAIRWLRAKAERLPCRAGTADLIVAAQAVQWFQRAAFYAEAMRVLRPRGVLAVVQNNRAWRDSTFLDDYERLLETWSPGYHRDYRAFDVLAEWRLAGGLACLSRVAERWVRTMTVEEFAGMSRSSTKFQAAVAAHGATAMLDRLRHLLATHATRTGDVAVPYETELFIGVTHARG